MRLTLRRLLITRSHHLGTKRSILRINPIKNMTLTGSFNHIPEEGKFCYYTWKADGTELLNEMPVKEKELRIPSLSKLSINPSASSLTSNISDTGTQTDQSPEPEFLDEATIRPKKISFASKDSGTIYKKPSISHFVKAVHHEERSQTGREKRKRRDSLYDSTHLPESRVLVLYTGGTVGMKCKESGVYEPEPHYLPLAIRELPPLNDREYVDENYGDVKVQPYCLPPVRNTKKRVVYWLVEYDPLLDSSDMTFDDWIRIAKDIRKSYDSYDGFVVLQGTDTLAYTASALSFMMENLGKPVVITGAQIPVAEVRSDGRENLIGALIVAGNYSIPEVTVYFNNKLLRGNRSTKLDNCGLDAFDSPNMHPLATMAINIDIKWKSVLPSGNISPFRVQENLCRNVSILRIFPSISIECVRAALQPPVQGVVLQTFGAGNMPSRRKDIIEEIKKAIDRGCIVLNVSQCIKGHVDPAYLTGKILYDVGVIPGSDMTTEAALIKLSYVLGHEDWDLNKKRKIMESNLRGEMTIAHPEHHTEHDIIMSLARNIGLSSNHEIGLLKSAVLPPLINYYAGKNDIEQLEKLRANGAALLSSDCNNMTPLHIAADLGLYDVVNYLLNNGASVHVKDNKQETPLLKAINGKHFEIVRILREAGASLNIPPVDIGLALNVAVSKDDIDAVRIWHEAGATFSEEDFYGRTPLHAAVNQQNIEMIKYLCRNGANPRSKDHFGKSPIDEALSFNRADIVEVLSEYANPNGKPNHNDNDTHGKIPFQIGGN